jgi:hypothetical protein
MYSVRTHTTNPAVSILSKNGRPTRIYFPAAAYQTAVDWLRHTHHGFDVEPIAYPIFSKQHHPVGDLFTCAVTVTETESELNSAYRADFEGL